MRQEQGNQLCLFAETVDQVIVSLETRLRESGAELARIRENWSLGLHHDSSLGERRFASVLA